MRIVNLLQVLEPDKQRTNKRQNVDCRYSRANTGKNRPYMCGSVLYIEVFGRSHERRNHFYSSTNRKHNRPKQQEALIIALSRTCPNQEAHPILHLLRWHKQRWNVHRDKNLRVAKTTNNLPLILQVAGLISFLQNW